MKNFKSRNLAFSIILPIGLLFFVFAFSQWQSINDGFDLQSNSATETNSTSVNDLNGVYQKHKGAHAFGEIDSTNFHFLKRNNIEWITIIEWSIQEDYDSPLLQHHNGDSSYIQQSDSGYVSRLKVLHSLGFKISMKPHVWINNPSDGKWRSDIFPTNEENWQLWKKSYREFVLRYAIIAQKASVEMFCIGTELSRLSIEKPAFWKDLIQEVRSIYHGKLIYAANWYNEYEKISFWQDLNYIGIQAYFPLAENEYPSVDQISEGWNKYLPSMASVSRKNNRKILFTEMGYKSTSDSAISPWEWIDGPLKHDKSYSTETQANCYEAFFNTVWDKEWFAGVHIWQLRSGYLEKESRNYNIDFTPLGKPAEHIIERGFQ